LSRKKQGSHGRTCPSKGTTGKKILKAMKDSFFYAETLRGSVRMTSLAGRGEVWEGGVCIGSHDMRKVLVRG
jgi:hypothetical protein